MNQDNLINMNANNLFKVLKIKLILGKICPHLTLKKRSEVQSNMIYIWNPRYYSLQAGTRQYKQTFTFY